MTFSVDDLIATARPRTEKVSVCARGDLVDRHLELTAELRRALDGADDQSIGNSPNPDVERIHEEILAVEAEQEDSTVAFTVRSIGSLAWQNLIRSNPPRPGLDHGVVFNRATFPPAAVAACVVDPELPLEAAVKMYGTDDEPGVLHQAEWERLFTAAWVLNETATPHPKLPAAIGNLLQSGRSSTTAATEASPAPPSSAISDAP